MKKLIAATTGAIMLAFAPTALADYHKPVTSKSTKISKDDGRYASLGCTRGDQLPDMRTMKVKAPTDEWTCDDTTNGKWFDTSGDGGKSRERIRAGSCFRQSFSDLERKSLAKSESSNESPYSLLCEIKYDREVTVGKKKHKTKCTVTYDVELYGQLAGLAAKQSKDTSSDPFVITATPVMYNGDCDGIAPPNDFPDAA